jgi:hypothetical protein
MKTGLTLFSLAALLSLVGVSIWATGHQDIGAAIRELAANPAGNPWFIATLFDTYFGFLWFWLWVAYKETSWAARIVWLLLILALGNIAMAIYVLIQVARLPSGARIEDLLLRRAA